MTPQDAKHRAPLSSSSDERLERMLVVLLGGLEQRAAAIRASDRPKVMTSAIDVGMGMLVAILDAGGGHFGDQCFATELPAVWRLRERSKITQDVLTREAAGGRFTRPAKATVSTQVMYYNLGHRFAEVFRDLLTRLRLRFDSEHLQRDFQESCDLLVQDFEHRW